VPRDLVERALDRAEIERRELAAGDIVFEEGVPGDALFLIVGGEVEVLKRGAVVAALGPGDYFGEMALMGEPVRTATVRCRVPTGLLVLRARAFRSLVARVPELGARLQEAAAHRASAPLAVA
jgi:CRP-like cAMP-binding protein